MVRRQRLVVEHIEDCGRELAAVERRDEVRLDEMPAARAVDDGGAARQAGEEPRIENAFGGRGERQQADEDLAAPEERAQAVATVEAGDSPQLARRPAPAGDVKAEYAELEHGVAAKLAQAEHADATLAGVGLRSLAPDPFALLRQIERVLAVQAQVVDLLRELQSRYSLAYLFISHDLRVVRALAHEVMVMKDGKVVERGPATQLFEAPREPYTRALMAAAFDLEVVENAATAQ